ncbi:Transport and Golgi organization 14 [Carabus blaptoides fortunei]
MSITCEQVVNNNHIKEDLLESHVINFYRETTDIDQINVAIKKLDKIPHHIVVVLGTETPSYRDLANIVVWCVAAGIPYISFYDHSGLLKRTKSELYHAVVQASLSTSSWNRTLTGNVLPAAAASKKNGVSAPLVHINVLSLSDGRGTLADLTRECVTSNVNSMKIAVDFLDEKLKKHLNHAPDPEMALCCGRVCSTYGVLPWQVRNTEFINIKTHHNIIVVIYIHNIRKYTNTFQVDY